MAMSATERKRFVILSTGRQDWGILRSTHARLAHDERLDVRLFVGGMGCSERFGRLDKVIEAEGARVDERLFWIDESGNESAAWDESAKALALTGEALARHAPDALLLVGDRYETLAAAMAATVLRIPIVHLHGGEETEGAFDNAFRHAITKLAHLHLVSHSTYAERVLAMGEPRETVHVVGAPALDNLRRGDLADRAELEAFLGAALVEPIVVVTVHPSTLATDPTSEVEAVIGTMRRVPATYVITLPNSDPGNQAIRKLLLAARTDNPRIVAVDALGERRYLGLLNIADAMLGNSSSGMIEAPAMHLPVVNVGDRQKGRIRSAGIVDVPPESTAVSDALEKVLSPEFRAGLRTIPPPFGVGNAAQLIGTIIADWRIPSPPVKRFTTMRMPL